jgi:hypothetical protein
MAREKLLTLIRCLNQSDPGSNLTLHGAAPIPDFLLLAQGSRKSMADEHNEASEARATTIGASPCHAR